MQYAILVDSENVYFAGFDGEDFSFAESIKKAKVYNSTKAVKKDIKKIKKMMTAEYSFLVIDINN